MAGKKAGSRARRRIKVTPGVGASTKLTPETQSKIVQLLRLGNYRETAAAAAGVSSRTLREWLKRGAKGGAGNAIYVAFAEAVEKAEAESEARDITQLTKAGLEDWRSIAWRLERKAASRWGIKHQLEHNVGGTLADLLAAAMGEDSGE